MFCTQCGVKRKKGEQCCSNCGRQFDSLVSLGVPAGFPGIYDSMKNQEKDESESDSDTSSDSLVPLINDGGDLKSAKSDDQGIGCRYAIKKYFPFIFLSTVVAVIAIVIAGQFVKKDETAGDNINEGGSFDTSESTMESTSSMYTSPTLTEYGIISDEISVLQDATEEITMAETTTVQEETTTAEATTVQEKITTTKTTTEQAETVTTETTTEQAETVTTETTTWQEETATAGTTTEQAETSTTETTTEQAETVTTETTTEQAETDTTETTIKQAETDTIETTDKHEEATAIETTTTQESSQKNSP